ncbi:MAG: hypothetical protein ACK4N5_02310 [Myxococcales bacterium]
MSTNDSSSTTQTEAAKGPGDDSSYGTVGGQLDMARLVIFVVAAVVIIAGAVFMQSRM